IPGPWAGCCGSSECESLPAIAKAQAHCLHALFIQFISHPLGREIDLAGHRISKPGADQQVRALVMDAHHAAVGSADAALRIPAKQSGTRMQGQPCVDWQGMAASDRQVESVSGARMDACR